LLLGGKILAYGARGGIAILIAVIEVAEAFRAAKMKCEEDSFIFFFDFLKFFISLDFHIPIHLSMNRLIVHHNRIPITRRLINH